MKFLVIHPNRALLVEGRPSLRFFTDLVGGDLQAVPVDETTSIYIDDEGKLKPHQRNYRAQEFAESLGLRLFEGDYLAGPVVFTSLDDDGEDIGTPEYVIAAARRAGLL